MRGGLSSRRKKVVLGGIAEASSVEDARKLLQKSKPKAHSRGGVGSKKQLRFAIRDARREQSELKRGVQWKDLVTKAQVRRGLVADQGAAPWPGREGASVKAPIKATVGQSIVKGPKGLSQTLGVAEEKKERGAVMRRAVVVCGRVWAEVAKAAVVVKDQKKKVEEEADGQLQAAVALSEAALGVDYARNFSRGVENSLTEAGGPDEDLPPLEDAGNVAESGLQAPLVASVGGDFEGALGAAEQTLAEVRKTVATMQGLVAEGVDHMEVKSLEKVLADRVAAASARMKGERERATGLGKAAAGLRDEYLASRKELDAAIARVDAKREEESRRAAVLGSKESELADYSVGVREMAEAVLAVGEAARRFGGLSVGSRGPRGGAAGPSAGVAAGRCRRG